MTLATEVNRIAYVPDGIEDTFTVPFMFLENDDLLVYLVDSDDDGTLQTLGVDYNVTGAEDPDGGEIEFVTPPDSADWAQVVIIRNVEMTQEADITADSPSPISQTVETALDRIVMMILRLDDRLDHSLHLGEFSDPLDADEFVALAEEAIAAAATIPINYGVQTVTGNGATAIVFSAGGYVILNVTGNCTPSFSGWPVDGINGRMTLEVRNTGAFGITWPAAIKWNAGTEPTLTSGAGKVDIFVLTTADAGATIYGHVVGQNFL